MYVPLGLFSEVCVLGIESWMEGEALFSVAFQTDTAPSFVSELGERILQTS